MEQGVCIERGHTGQRFQKESGEINLVGFELGTLFSAEMIAGTVDASEKKLTLTRRSKAIRGIMAPLSKPMIHCPSWIFEMRLPSRVSGWATQEQ
jgi:hypothetical protein